MKKGLKTLLIIVIVIGVIVGGGFLALKAMGGNPDDVIIENMSVDGVADGTYQGAYETTLVSAKVEVTVAGGEIVDIKILEQDCGPGYDADGITDNIISANSLDIDTISGATMSSKVIMKSVELALDEGR